MARGRCTEMGKKRDTFTGQPTVPRYFGTGQIEVAKHLMSVCRRFIADRANVDDVNKAIEIWREETAPGACPTCRGRGYLAMGPCSTCGGCGRSVKGEG